MTITTFKQRINASAGKIARRLTGRVTKNLFEYGDGALVIVLEGPDGAGKSTLAEALVREWIAANPSVHTGEVRHVGPPDAFKRVSAKESEYLDELIAHRVRCTDRLLEHLDYCDEQKGTHLVVFDRMHWGSPVYGSLYRPESNSGNYGDIGLTGFKTVTRRFNKLGALTLLVMPDISTLIERSHGREDEYLDNVDGANARDKQLLDIYNEYIRVAYENTSAKTKLSYTDPSYATVLNAESHLPASETVDSTGRPQNLMRVVNDRNRAWCRSVGFPCLIRLISTTNSEHQVALETVLADDLNYILAHACNTRRVMTRAKQTEAMTLTWRYFTSSFNGRAIKIRNAHAVSTTR